MLKQLFNRAKHLLVGTLLLVPLSAQAVDVQVSALTDIPDPAVRAGELTYTVSVLNASADTANNVVLTLPLPATTTYVSDDNASCTHAGGTPGTLTCNLGNITGDGVGGPVTTINTVIRTSAATGNTVDVTATVSTSSSDTNTGNNVRTQQTTIDDGADLVATITDSPDPVAGAAIVDYTVAIDNNGPNNAALTTVTNTLPADTTFVSAAGTGWSCGNSGQVVTCTRSSTAVGTTTPDILIRARVTGASSGTITNSVTVSSTTGDPEPSNNTTTEDTAVSNGTDLSIGLSVNPNPVSAGDIVSFYLAPRNIGPADPVDARVVYTFPTGFTPTSSSPFTTNGWSCTYSGLDLTCNHANFSVSNTNNIVVTATAPATGDITSTATISIPSNLSLDQVASNNNASISGAIVPSGADLSISKSKSPNPVVNGGTITSTITVTNNGPDNSSGTTTVTDALIDEDYVGFSGIGWACSAPPLTAPVTVTCTHGGVIIDGATAPLLIITTTAVANNSTISNIATVIEPTDQVNGNNFITASTLSTDPTDLSVAKTATTPGADTTLTASENTITYTLTVQNDGPTGITGSGDAVYVTDTIPFYTTGTGVTVTGSTSRFTCTATAGFVECRLNSATVMGTGAGNAEVITIEATRPFAAGTSHVNTAYVSSSTHGDTNSSNNSVTAPAITVDSVTIADVEVTGKIITPSTVKAGVEATYVISFRNNGPASADNVTIQDVFTPPAGRSYTVVSVTPSAGAGTCLPFGTTPNTLNCTTGTMTSGQAESITVVVRPEWDAANTGWTMDNTATISTTTNQGANTAVDFQTATLTVTPAEIDLLVNDTDLTDPIIYTSTPGTFPGSLDNVIVYKIDMTNRGPSRATNVSLENVMTPKSGKTLTFLCDDVLDTTCTVGTSTCNNTNTAVTGPAALTLTCPQPAAMDSNVGAPLVRHLFFRVNTVPDAGNDTHFNLSTISANEDESDNLNNSENEDTTVLSPVALGITKAPSIASVSVEQSFNWDIVVFKDGTTDAPSTTVSDTLPAGMVLTGAPTTSQGTCTGVANATSFTCNLGTVVHRTTSGTPDAANDVAITVPVRLTTYPTGGTITNTASANSPSYGTVSNSGTVTVTNTALGITKAPSVASVSLNQNFNWDIVVFKNGPADVPNTTVTDTLPAGMVLTGTPTTDQGLCTQLSTTSFSCNLGTVIHRAVSGTADANDVAITVPTQVTVMPTGGTTTNTATASAPGFGSVSDAGVVTVIAPLNLASVSGQVHDRDDLSSTHGEWVVEIYQNGVLVGTTVTDASNGYSFTGLQPGTGYEIYFRHPESNAVFGVIDNITLTANTNLPNQNFPLDPSGVVYNSITRQPVPGAIVTFSGPPGYDPATHLIGGVGNVNQTVGSDGMYKYLLNPSAPAGVYSLVVTQPAGYIPPNSLNIPAPCDDGVNPALVVGPVPDPASIQSQVTAPPTTVPFHNPNACPALGASGTQYYLSFNLDGTSADVLNNHIPLDPEGSGLSILKTTPKTNVIRGELVPYTVRITNNLAQPITGLRLRDQIPPGFKYVANSATLDGARSEPIVNGRELTWPAQNYAVSESHEVKLLLVVGAGVGEGEYVNQAWGANALTDVRSTIIANATVRIIADPTFDCTDLIGKVFDDKNTNGYQDEGEKGLSGIRVVTARGLSITTDPYGRYHVPCAAIPDEMRGSNFILKLDEQSLPSGYRVTTENPRVIRVTRGKLAKLNFGAAIHRVIRVDLSESAFDGDSDQLNANYHQHMDKLIEVLGNQPSVVHVAYSVNAESKLQVIERLRSFRNELESKWGNCDCNYELILEEKILWEPMTTRGSVSTRRAPK